MYLYIKHISPNNCGERKRHTTFTGMLVVDSRPFPQCMEHLIRIFKMIHQLEKPHAANRKAFRRRHIECKIVCKFVRFVWAIYRNDMETNVPRTRHMLEFMSVSARACVTFHIHWAYVSRHRYAKRKIIEF